MTYYIMTAGWEVIGGYGVTFTLLAVAALVMTLMEIIFKDDNEE